MGSKRKRRPRKQGPAEGGTANGRASETRRRRHKEEARRLREEARRRARRRVMLRRGAVFGGLAVALAVVIVVFRTISPAGISAEARAAAQAAGCTEVSSPAGSAPGDIHLQPGQSYTYDQRPATSGPHDPSPLPAEPKVHGQPIPETRAVHNLEHAYVIVYYRADGPEALPTEAVDELAELVTDESKTMLAPYPDLPEGVSLALTAWNKLQTCPSGVEPAQAREIAKGFIDAYRGTNNAPEPFAG